MIIENRLDPNGIYPIEGYDNEIYVKPTIKNPRNSVFNM